MKQSAHTEEHGSGDEVQLVRREVGQIQGARARRKGRTLQMKIPEPQRNWREIMMERGRTCAQRLRALRLLTMSAEPPFIVAQIYLD